jgi:hypothetical protein
MRVHAQRHFEVPADGTRDREPRGHQSRRDIKVPTQQSEVDRSTVRTDVGNVCPVAAFAVHVRQGGAEAFNIKERWLRRREVRIAGRPRCRHRSDECAARITSGTTRRREKGLVGRQSDVLIRRAPISKRIIKRLARNDKPRLARAWHTLEDDVKRIRRDHAADVIPHLRGIVIKNLLAHDGLRPRAVATAKGRVQDRDHGQEREHAHHQHQERAATLIDARRLPADGAQHLGARRVRDANERGARHG